MIILVSTIPADALAAARASAGIMLTLISIKCSVVSGFCLCVQVCVDLQCTYVESLGRNGALL